MITVNTFFIRLLLLIVPYGIEIRVALPLLQPAYLLIVPYGIEMSLNEKFLNRLYTFNRTLWNWNRSARSRTGWRTAFNRTLWNWNDGDFTVHISRAILLIVPYGIEIFTFERSCAISGLLIVPYGIEIAFVPDPF